MWLLVDKKKECGDPKLRSFSLRSAASFELVCLIYVLFALFFSIFLGGTFKVPLGILKLIIVLCGFFAAVYSISVTYRIVRFGARPWRGVQIGSVVTGLVQKLVQLFCVVVFYDIFTVMKNNMQYANNYNWDEGLANIDKYLHMGNDAWVIYSKDFAVHNIYLIDFIYVFVWGLIIIGVVVHCILFEKDKDFRSRFLLSYAFVWIFLGNIVAVIFLSAGPIYYDNFNTELSRFSDLIAYQESAGFSETNIARIQAFLLEAHNSGQSHFGSGISAFPSLHVATAALSMFYFLRKSKIMFFMSLLFLIIIQFTSVLSGYHYAIDGYFSIMIVVVLWYGYTARSPRSKDVAPESELISSFGKC